MKEDAILRNDYITLADIKAVSDRYEAVLLQPEDLFLSLVMDFDAGTTAEMAKMFLKVDFAQATQKLLLFSIQF